MQNTLSPLFGLSHSSYSPMYVYIEWVVSTRPTLCSGMSQSSNALKMELPYPLALQIVKHARKTFGFRR